MSKRIGFIGLGIMGRPMAKNLLKAGYTVYCYDLNTAAVQELVEAGAIGCSSVGEVGDNVQTIITMLPNSPHVKAVALGEGGLIEHCTAGTLLVDMTSLAPNAAKEISAALAKKGIRMIDAPVSGGEPKAVDGTLAIMVGGEEADYLEAKPLFDVLGSSSVHIGALGSGNICKLTNQVIVAVNIAALAEGMTLARQAGADPEKVYQAIRSGLAGSTVMDAKTHMMLGDNFKPGFRIDLHIKDLANALETGSACVSPMPHSSAVQQMFLSLRSHGDDKLDHSALWKYYQNLLG